MATAQAVVKKGRPFIRTSQLGLREDQVLLVAFRAHFISTLLRSLCILCRHGLDVGLELIPQLRSYFGSCRYLYLRQKEICT
jgi:hypothetical protein